MKKVLFLFVLLFSIRATAQKVIIRSVTEVDVNTILYPNLAGNTTYSQPHKGTVNLTDGSVVKSKITFFK